MSILKNKTISIQLTNYWYNINYISDLCKELGINDDEKQKKFVESMKTNLVNYSEFSFIPKFVKFGKEQIPQIIDELHHIEKPTVLITIADIELIIYVHK